MKEIDALNFLLWLQKMVNKMTNLGKKVLDHYVSITQSLRGRESKGITVILLQYISNGAISHRVQCTK